MGRKSEKHGAKMRALFAVLAMASLCRAAYAEPVTFESGNDIHSACADATLFAMGYVIGASDRDQLASYAGSSVCLPIGVEVRQLTDVMCNFLQAHPEMRHLNASTLAIMALSAAWPCTH